MSQPESTPRRRPVPPPKTESEARLRQELTSPTQPQDDGSKRSTEMDTGLQGEVQDAEAQKKKAMKHLTLPPGWDLRNSVDVTYHTHVAKPVVHETIYHETTELVEPRITREYHIYHQYDHIQPLEAEIPDQSYATNADGEVIHAPGGLSTRAGHTSHWEQNRQDRGYGLSGNMEAGEKQEEKGTEVGLDSTAGPFPLKVDGDEERVLDDIRHGEVAKRFGGTLTASRSAPSDHDDDRKDSRKGHISRPRGGDLEEAPGDRQSGPTHTYSNLPQDADDFQTPPEPTFRSGQYHHLKSDPTDTLNQEFNTLSLHQDGKSEAKPLPPLPDATSQSSHQGGGVRRMSGENKLRERYSSDSNRRSLEVQNPNTE